MYDYLYFGRYNDLINFLNENNIKKENIIKLFHFDIGFALIYYKE